MFVPDNQPSIRGADVTHLHQSLRAHLGPGSEQYLSSSRIEMMLSITRHEMHDTILMAFGYIIEMLRLTAKSDPRKASDCERELQVYQERLKQYASSTTAHWAD